MELRRRLDPKVIFIGLYVVLFIVYIVVGLQPAGAVNYQISAQLSIPGVGIYSDVAKLELVDGKINTPDTIVGSYSQAPHKTLLVGHSVGVFQNVSQISLGDTIEYNDQKYHVSTIDMVRKGSVDMANILKSDDKDTIVLMTCAGTLLDGGDATHRLIVTAVAE